MSLACCLARVQACIAGVVLLMFCAAATANTTLLNVSFEPNEGYPESGSIVGRLKNPPQWRTWAGGEPVIAAWNAIDGGRAVRLWGTSTGCLEFNHDPAQAHVRVEGYVLLNTAPPGAGSASFGLLSAQEEVAWDIGVTLGEDGTLKYQTKDGQQAAADGLTVKPNTFYHILIDADYTTGQAKIYVGVTKAGNPTVLSDANLVSFGGKQAVAFTGGAAYAAKVGLDVYAGAESFFDSIKVITIPVTAQQQTQATAIQAAAQVAGDTYRIPTRQIVRPVIGLCGGGRFSSDGLAFMADTGIRSIRFHYLWSEVEQTKGHYDLPHSAFDFMRDLQGSKLELLHILAYDNPLYDKIPKNKLPDFGWFLDQGPEFVKGYADYCGWMARTFGSKGTGQIHYWEIWNEQNAGAADQYMNLLRQAVQRIREEDPLAYIVMGGVSRANLKYIRECMKDGAGELVDAVAFHPYREDRSPEEPFALVENGFDPEKTKCYADEVRAIRQTVDQYTPAGKKIALWVTEMGYWTSDAEPNLPKKWGVSLDTQAKYLLRAYIQNFALGISHVYWYDITGSFGIKYGNQQMRPAYYALRNLTKVLPQEQNIEVQDWAVTAEPAVRDLHVYALKTDPKTVLLFLWKAGRAKDQYPYPESWSKCTLTIPTVLDRDAMRATMTDLFGGIEVQIEAQKSGENQTRLLDVPLWDSPVVIKLQLH